MRSVRKTHRRRGSDREDQWPSALENRDGMAVDALVMTVFMATSCSRLERTRMRRRGRDFALAYPPLSRPRARMAACAPHVHNRRTSTTAPVAMRHVLLACGFSLS